MNNAKFVTRRAKQRMMNTIVKLGTTAKDHQASISDLRWTERMKRLKTTKFTQSKPVVTVSKGKIPF